MKQLNPTTGRALVDAFTQSDLSVKQFCVEQGVSYAVLKYWRSRIAELDAEQAGAFVQVETSGSVDPSSAAAVVVLPNGVRLAFQQSVAVTPALIAALSQC